MAFTRFSRYVATPWASAPSSSGVFANVICSNSNGRVVRKVMGVVRQNGALFGFSGSLRTSSTQIFFSFASPSIKDVTTLDPGCDT